MLLRKDPVPDLLLRAATKTDFRSGPMDDQRRLDKLFSTEYADDLNKLVEEDRERVRGLKDDLLEEAQRELIKDKANISRTFGVNTSVNTSYASPKVVKPKEPKEKKKSLFTKKEPNPGLVLTPNLAAGPSDFTMPTGSNLDINKGYLNKIKKQLEKREEKAAMKQLSNSLPLPSNMTTTNNSWSTSLSTASSAKPAPSLSEASSGKPSVKTSLSVASSAKPSPSPPHVQAKPAPGDKASAAKLPLTGHKASTSKQPSSQLEIERLKGLGLTVKVDQVQKPENKVDLSKYVVSSQKTAAGKSTNVKSPSTKIEAPAKPSIPSAPSYTAPQKLQLKSQMLAYRMLARGEILLDVVMKAATSRNLKALGLPKDEMKKLGNVFTKEYSGR